jgi:hypothetical protein
MVAHWLSPSHKTAELFMDLGRLTSQILSERHSPLTSYQDQQAEVRRNEVRRKKCEGRSNWSFGE